eukprot:scaffold7.g3619.t1
MVSLCLAVLLAVCLGAEGQPQLVSNSKELQEAMYPRMKGGDACVRLLNATGQIGCAAPGGRDAVGTLVRVDALLPAAADYPDGAAVLLPPALLPAFLGAAQADAALAARVAGVLVEALGPGEAAGYSQDAVAPQAEYALYEDRAYAWNPAGTGLSRLDLPFPVFQLDGETTAQARARAAYNAEQKGVRGALHVARMGLEMQAAGNSSACLAAQTCLPLGGHSVLAALPPLPAAGAAAVASGGASLILALAQADSGAFFHELATGAESSVSGLIALLAAANILGSAPAPGAAYSRHVVFGALAGEAWGHMGSKRLLWEAAQGNASVKGLSLGSVEAIVEVGQVGRAGTGSTSSGGAAGGAGSSGSGGSESFSFFAHVDKRPAATPAGSLVAALHVAAGNASSDAGAAVGVAAAGPAAPGLPPCSAASFLRVAAAEAPPVAIPAVVLADHDATFRGSTYHSSDDGLGAEGAPGAAGISADSVAAAAATLAHALHQLAWDPSVQPLVPLQVNWTETRALVGALSTCLLNSSVGLQCPLARALLTPTTSSTSASRYVNVLRTITADPQTPDPSAKSDYERFLWSFLAFATATNYALNASSPGPAPAGGGGEGEVLRCQPLNTTACPPGWACAGYHNLAGDEGMGVCLNTTARYVPAYSTSLACPGCNGTATLGSAGWALTDAAAAWEAAAGWPPDPVWTESNWPNETPSLVLYLQEDPATDWAVFAAGCAATAASLAAALGVQAAWSRQRRRR